MDLSDLQGWESPVGIKKIDTHLQLRKHLNQCYKLLLPIVIAPIVISLINVTRKPDFSYKNLSSVTKTCLQLQKPACSEL